MCKQTRSACWEKVSRRGWPRLTSEIKSNISVPDFYLQKATRTGAELDWSTYRRMRNRVTLMIRKSKANQGRTLFRENINTLKEAGNNNLPPKILKDAADELSAPLCRQIDKGLQVSLFPKLEICGKITPVFKSVNPTILHNQRPITAIRALSEVIEKIIYNQLSVYFE